MKVNLEFKLTIEGVVPCGEGNYKPESEAIEDVRRLSEYLKDIITDELYCDSLTVELVNTKEEITSCNCD